MKTSGVLSILAVAATAAAQYATASSSASSPSATAPPSTNGTLGPDDDGKYEISAEGIRAQFIPYGASITNLFVKDRNGVERDIVLGFDNASYYSVDPLHPHLGGVPGTFRSVCINHGLQLMYQQVAMQTASRTARSTLMASITMSRPTRMGARIRFMVGLMAGTG